MRIMERILKRIKTNVMVSAFICMTLGIILVVWPGLSVKVVCMAIGVVLVINGISRLMNFIFGRDGSVFSQMNLIMGIIITVIGGWILFQPGTIIAMIPILVGIIIVIHGINNLQQTMSLCQSRYDKWWVALLLALVTIGFGVLLIFNPPPRFLTKFIPSAASSPVVKLIFQTRHDFVFFRNLPQNPFRYGTDIFLIPTP